MPAPAGSVARQLLEAVLGRGGMPTSEQVARALDLNPDAVGDACLRLVERARQADGRAALETLLDERSDAQLAGYVRQVVRNAQAEDAPGYAYRRALRNHVTALARNGSEIDEAAAAPTRLQIDGRIQRDAVAGALAAELQMPDLAHVLVRVRSSAATDDDIKLLTGRLAARFPPDLEGPVREHPPDGDTDRPRGAREPSEPAGEAELALRRRIDARKKAGVIETVLGDDQPLFELAVRGATLDQIARDLDIPRSTVADRLARTKKRLEDARKKFPSLGTMAEALRRALARRR